MKLANGREFDFANVPEVDGPSAIFGTTDYLPAWDVLPEDFRRGHHPCCRHVSSLFFRGGALSPTGWRLKAGLSSAKVSACIQGHLCSFEPKHEHKIGGVGFMLAQWFEPAEAQP